jgi:hypothetical protein
MNQQYSEIREGLIALLCVGDKIYYIYNPVGLLWDMKTKFKHSIPITIRENTVVSITDKHVLVTSSYTGDKPFEVDFKFVQAYEGKLYCHPKFNIEKKLCTPQEIIDDIASIVNSKETVYE